jgi:hypothetical protein
MVAFLQGSDYRTDVLDVKAEMLHPQIALIFADFSLCRFLILSAEEFVLK